MTKKLSKKLISIFLSLLMVLSLIPTGMMTAFAAATEGDCSFCGHPLSSHKDKNGNGISNDTIKVSSCSQCSETPECYDFAWVIALEGDNNPLNKPEQHECSNNTLVHYMITGYSGNKFKCKQYKFDSTREKWFALVASKSIDTTIFPEGASANDGKFYMENPDSAGTYIECVLDSTPDWVDTIISKADAVSEDLYSEAWGATLKGYFGMIDFDSLDSLVSDMDAPEYSQEGSVYTIEGENSYGNFIVTITLDADENIASVALNYADAYTATFTPAPTGPDTSSWPTSYVHDDCQHSGVVHFYATGVIYGNDNGNVEGRMFYDSTNYDDMYDGSPMVTVVSAFETNGADIEGWYYWDGGFYPCSAPAGPATCGKCVNCGHAGHGTFPSNHTVCSACTSNGGACRGSNIFNAKVCVLPEGHTGPCSETASTTPDWVATITSKVDAVASELVVEESGHTIALTDSLEELNASTFAELVDSLTNKEYSQADNVYTIEGNWNTEKMCINVTLDADENVASVNATLADSEGVYTDLTFTPAPAGPQKMGETNTYWELEDGVLTISGTGATPDFSNQNPVPWSANKSDITSIVIENEVTAIGNHLFNGCSKVASVTIPNSVTTIGDYAFNCCSALASITLPNNLTTIGSNTFKDTGLTSVSIPNSVTSIGNGAFHSCGSLASVTLPTGITTIASYTFQRCGSLTSITIPNGVTSIGGSAFSLCGNLASVTIPSSVTSIGSYAFEECEKLANVTLPSSGLVSIGSGAFTYCSALTNFTFPSTVTTIEASAFAECSNLTEITLPSTVTSIGGRAFEKCSKLASVVVNATTVPTLGSNAFKNCSSDLVIYVPEESVTDYKTSWTAYEDKIEAIPTAGNLCPDFSTYDDTYYGHIYIMEIDSPILSIVFYDTQQDDPTRLVLGKVGAVLTEERYKNVNEVNTWYHYDKATDKYYKCSTQGEGSHPAFHKKYTMNYTGTQWLYGGSVPVYEGDKVYTAIADDGNECYAYNDGKKLEYGNGFTSVIVKIDGNSIYFCSDHTGDYGTFCDNCTPPCGLCTECGHPWAKHDPVGDCCSLCPVGDGCFDEILGEQCVLKSGHDGAHDPWLTITDTDDINAILTKVVGEFKDAEYPDDYSIKISGNATDGFSFVYKSDGLDYNAVFVKAKQKGNEVYLEINFDIDSSTYQAGFTFKFDSQGKLTNCYQVTYEDGDVDDYYGYPYTHVHTWNNGTCTLDGTTCSHTGMTTSDATCGTCGITNPSYVPPHTHTYATEWSSDATQHWYAATCEHTTEKSSLGNHSGGTATCTAAAVCSTCGASYGTALGHSFATEWSKDSTHHWHAATCGHDTEKSGYAQHSYTSEVTTPATCTSAGVTTYTCTCGATYTDTTAPAALGHSFTNYIPNNNATCTADGTKTATCGRTGCGVTDTITDEGTATGHSYAETWSSDENTHWYAATCEHTTLKSNEANHTYGETGSARYTCSVCSAVNEAKKLQIAKAEAKAAIDAYVVDSESEDAHIIAENAKMEIESAETVEDVNDIKDKALEDIKDIIAPDFKTLAKDLKYDGTEVKLTKDYTRALGQEGITIKEGQKVVIDLNGHTIDGANDETVIVGCIFNVDEGAELVINDSTDNKGVITGGTGYDDQEGSRFGGAIYNNGTTTINDGVFTGNIATYGGAIRNHGTLTINGGVFTKNTANTEGGALDNCYSGSNKGKMVITGGTFTENSSKYYGGAIENYQAESLTIIGGTFTGNTATVNGGAIDNDGAPLYIGGSAVIKDNKVGENTNNVEVYGAIIVLDEETALTENAEIGITLNASTDTIIASGATLDTLKALKSDNADKMFIVEDGALKLQNIADHVHSFGETGEDRYNCQTCGALDEDEKAAVLLADAKEDAKDAISDAFAGCEENAVLDVATNYFKAIDDAKTIAEVNKLKAEGIKAVKDAMHKHSYKKTVIKAATYNADGKAQYTCSCGDSYTKVIPRLKVTSTVKYNNSTKLDASFKVTTSTKDVTAKWGKVADADGYIVYAAYCGKDFKAIKTIKGAATTSYTFTKLDGKKLDLNKNIKVYVVAYKTIDGKKVEFGKSISGHVIGGWSRTYTNPTKVTVKNNKVTLAKGKTSTIKATVTYKYPAKKHLSDAHAAEKRYRSSNKAVATVDANGKIKAVGKGTCTIYVFAKNGTSTKVTVTVK